MKFLFFRSNIFNSFKISIDLNPDPLCGIVSWGRGCALAGYPGVYAQASTFVDWAETNSS